jgi:hypothetical protein
VSDFSVLSQRLIKKKQDTRKFYTNTSA